jgi:hypothetical protein
MSTRKRACWFAGLLEACARLRASRTLHRQSPRMVKRRNSRYQAFRWGAPRRVPIDCTPQQEPPMLIAPPGRTRLRRAWSKRNPGGVFVI